MGEDIRRKIALFCNVKEDCVISDVTLPCLYESPIMLHKNGLDKVVVRELGLKGKLDLKPWKTLVAKINSRKGEVKVALVGKYVKLHDSYLSVVEALNAAGYENGVFVNIKWVDSDELTEDNLSETFDGVDGIIVPGGFGNRGIEGMILSCKWARENGIPYFGICLGMQIMVIEFARDVCGLKNATSGEFDAKSEHKVIDIMPDQKGVVKKGGTMRLGAYPCKIKAGTIMERAYKKAEISERHRHRYEFNNYFRELLIEKGLVVSGTSPDENIVETVELKRDKFFLGAQFHPEFKSRPNAAHPLFIEFIRSCKEK